MTPTPSITPSNTPYPSKAPKYDIVEEINHRPDLFRFRECLRR
jgi:hypothetical protein